MPREIWSVQLEITLQKALGQLSILEKRLRKIELKFKTMGAAAGPAASRNMAALGVSTKAAGTAATGAAVKFGVLFSTLKGGFSGFLNIVAKRLAFTVAAMVELFTFAFVLAIPAAFIASIKVGAEFEDAMLRTATVASGGANDITDAFNVMSQAAREFAIVVPFTATEVANAMFEMVSSGISATQTIGAMPAILNFAGAAMTDLTTSVDIMTQVMKSFGLTAEDLDDVADILVVGLNNTTLTVERLAAGLRFAAPAGGAFEQSIEDTVIVLSLFVDATKQGGIAGRAFRFMLSSLANPTAAATAVLSNLRDTTTQLIVPMKDFALTIDGSPRSIVDVLSRLAATTITSSQVLEAFGNRSGPVVALALKRLRREAEAGGVEMGKFANTMVKLQTVMADGKAANVATQQFQKFLTSTSNQFKLLKATGEEALIRIFLAIQPLLNSLLKLSKSVLANQTVIQEFVKVAGFLATALLFLAGVLIGKMVLGLVAMALSSTLAAGAAGALTVQLGFLGRAMVLLTKVVPFAVFALLIFIFQDLQAETNGLGLTLEALSRAFGGTATAADESKENLSLVGKIVDSLRISLALGAVAFLKYQRLLVTTNKIAADMIPGMKGISTSLEEQLVAIDDMISSYEDEVIAIRKTFGVREERLDQGRRMAAESEKRLEAVQAILGVEAASLASLEALTDQETEFLDLIVQRSEKEQRLAGTLEDTNLVMIRAIAANETLNEVVFLAARQTLDMIAKNIALVALRKAEEAQLKALAQAYKNILPEQGKAIESLRDLGLVLEDMIKKGLKPTDQELVSMVQTLKDYETAVRTGAIQPSLALKAQMFALGVQLNVYRQGMGLVIGTTTEWGVKTKGLPPLLKDVEAQLRETFDTKTTKEFEESLTQLHNDFNLLEADGGRMARGAFKELQLRFFELAVEMFQAGEGSKAAKAELDRLSQLLGVKLPQDLAAAEAGVESFSDTVVTESAKTKTVFQDMWDKVVTGFGNAIGEMIFKATSFRKFFEDLFKGLLKFLIAQIFSEMVQHFTKALGAMEGAVSTTGEQLTEELGGVLGGLKDTFTDFSAGGIAAMVGIGIAVAALIFSLFKSKDAINDIKSDLQSLGGVSQELAEKIEESSKSLGRWAAQADNLRAIMDEVGVSTENFGQFVDIVRKTLINLDGNTINTAQAISILDQSFQDLVDEMTRLGIVGNQQIITLMRDLQSRGLEVASVMEFINTNLSLAASGLEVVFRGALINTQEELDRLGRLALAVFNGMIQSGASLADVMRELGPALDRITETLNGQRRANQMLDLAEAFLTAADGSEQAAEAFLAAAKAIGQVPNAGEDAVAFAQRMVDELERVEIRASKALRELLRFNRLVEDNKELIESFNGLNDVLTGLANLGLLTEEIFEDMLLQAGKMATDLMKAGITGKDAFILMAPFLRNLIRLAAEHGFEIDDATQKLIDQAEEYGVLGEDAETEQDTMRAGFLSIVDAIDRLIDALTGSGGVTDAVDEVADSFDELGDDASEVFAEMTSGAGTAMSAIADSALVAVDTINRAFKGLEENLVGNTVFRNIAEHAGDFLREIGKDALLVADQILRAFDGVDSEFNLKKLLGLESLEGLSFADLQRLLRELGLRDTKQHQDPRNRQPKTTTHQATAPQASAAEQQSSNFERKNLALLQRIVDAVRAAAGDGTGTGSPRSITATRTAVLRQTISEVLREATLDGEAEIHADSVSILN